MCVCVCVCIFPYSPVGYGCPSAGNSGMRVRLSGIPPLYQQESYHKLVTNKYQLMGHNGAVVSTMLCMRVPSAMRTHEVNGQQCEVKKAQAKGDEMPRGGGGGRGMSSSDK